MDWTEFVTKYYRERKSVDKDYKFKSAMTDATESYYSQAPGAKVKKYRKSKKVKKTKRRRTGKRLPGGNSCSTIHGV